MIFREKMMINNKCQNFKAKNILFLGYSREETKLINFLNEKGCTVDNSEEIIVNNNYDMIISFGYKKIIKKQILEKISCPILNLHISYLPYNRGSHPNFWAFFDNTPSGVTIHQIDEGIDTGPILYQKYVFFNRGEKTFKQTYERLKEEIEDLFIINANDILNFDYKPTNQLEKGTIHLKRDLPSEFSGWDSEIYTEIAKLRNTDIYRGISNLKSIGRNK